MKYTEIFDYFGFNRQRRKLVEEVNEFNDEILLYEKGYNNKEKIVDELADIVIVLNGFIKKYKIKNEEIEEHIKDKKERLDKRIKTGYYK